jgi:c-di-GMP-binding flagellar brake protein YcgR
MPDKFKGGNRRKAQRRDAAFTVTYGVKKPYALRVILGLTDDLDALMQDLSESGMAFITGHELPRGTQLEIKFNFINLFLSGQERSRRMGIAAEVVSCTDQGKGNYRIGVNFNNISEGERIAIRNFIKLSK